jgi:hypothetical protein
MGKKIYQKAIATIAVCLWLSFADANDHFTPSVFQTAKQEIENMLSGKIPLSYERAIFITENAYWKNELSEVEFSELISFHTENIRRLIQANSTKTEKDFTATILKSSEKQLSEYQAALTNYAIFLYMTDTTFFIDKKQIKYHQPFIYSNQDPLGTVDFTNTQVNKLLYGERQQGNCFALTSLFRIFSERLKSDAIICTAPGHIYIRHADDRGIYHNVELGSKTFPGAGTISTITYTTDQALRSNISLRELSLQQSVGLCLIYLAKGYEYQSGEKGSDFALQCAELALQNDSLNLNAMLLKSEVLETRLINKGKSVAQLQNDKQFQEYQKLITHLFDLGYREMPSEQKRMIIEKLRNPDMMIAHYSKMQEKSKEKSFETRTATLSWGLFDEEMKTKTTEVFGRTSFNSSAKKITNFISLDSSSQGYPIDLTVFAWQVDPLAAKFPSMSPYAAFGNNPIIYVDPDGKANTIYLVMLPSSKTELTKTDAKAIQEKIYQNLKNMGLENVNIVVYDEEANGKFDGANLDKSDVAVGLGSPNEGIKFAQENIVDKQSLTHWENWQGNSSIDEKGQPIPNPEKSEPGNSKNEGSGRVITVDVTNTENALSAWHVSKNDLISNSVTHGISAHSANDYNHTRKETDIDANITGGGGSRGATSWNFYFQSSNSNKINGDRISTYKFNSKIAKDNYSSNKELRGRVGSGVGIR